MAALTLVIGNKNYSSWSMRPWVLLKQLGIPFEEKKLRFHSNEWNAEIERWSPSRLVPVLWRGDQAVWDTLAIMEAVNEWYPDRGVWPHGDRARAFARSAAAEMHAGFRELRTHMPMNIRSSHPGKGRTPAVEKDIARIIEIWESCRTRFGEGGELLFGSFTCADAMYAPVVMRFLTYGVELPAIAQRYFNAVLGLPGVVRWRAGAAAETQFVAADEP